MALLNCFQRFSRSAPQAARASSLGSMVGNEHTEPNGHVKDIDGRLELQSLGDSQSSNLDVKSSLLLSLPKELRLEIWRYVLTDRSEDNLVVRIQRNFGPCTSSKRFFNSLYKYAGTLDIKCSFKDPPDFPISVSLLRTNRFIYNEALPVLYHAVTFCPLNLEGVFLLFLENLSPFAQSQIRCVRLIMENIYGNTGSIFYWALTCAQIAKLSETLRVVEVQGFLPRSDDHSFYRRALLYPLLKIKAPKIFVVENATGHITSRDREFQQLLDEAARELEAKADLRRALTDADFAERRKLANSKRSDIQYPPVKMQKLQDLTVRSNPRIEKTSLSVDESDIANDLAAIPGIGRFEEELLEWVMVSVPAGSSSPEVRPPSAVSEASWIDTVSTLVDKDKEDGSIKEVDGWELVGESSAP